MKINGLRLVPPLGNLYRVGCSPHNTWPGTQQAPIRAQVHATKIVVLMYI